VTVVRWSQLRGRRRLLEETDDGGSEMMDGGMMGGWFMVLWTLLILAVIALAVAGVVWLVRNMDRSRGDGRGGAGVRSAAREELDRRFAAGELSRDEYLERRRDLDS
jgi:putative membrane protein